MPWSSKPLDMCQWGGPNWQGILLSSQSLIKSKHSTLENGEGQYPKANQGSLYQHLIPESFDAHDALGDVIAVGRIFFSNKLSLSHKSLLMSV